MYMHVLLSMGLNRLVLFRFLIIILLLHIEWHHIIIIYNIILLHIECLDYLTSDFRSQLKYFRWKPQAFHHFSVLAMMD